MVPHLRGCESLRAGNYSVGRRRMSPSAPEGLPSTRWICLAGPEWLWNGTQGLSPGGIQLEIQEPPESSGWDFSLGTHLGEEVLQCGCRRWVLNPPLAPPAQARGAGLQDLCYKSQGEVKAGKTLCLRIGCVPLQPHFYHSLKHSHCCNRHFV